MVDNERRSRMLRSKRRRFQRTMKLGGGDGFPNSGNTGPRRNPTTTFVGNLSTTADNQIIENMRITAGITINHNNVTIRDCFIGSDPSMVFGITTNPTNLTPALIEYCTIAGDSGRISGNNAGISTVFTGVQEIRFCNVYGFENGIFPGRGSNIHDCYIHDLNNFFSGDPHVDGIQINSDTFSPSNTTINRNTIVSWDTSCVIIGGVNAINNVIITNNKLLGRGGSPGIAYGINFNPTAASDSLTITGNRIGNILDFASGNPTFPINVRASTTNRTISGNFNYYSGALITPSLEP